MSPPPTLSPEYLHSAYLRVASLAVGLYELLHTLPAEYRFYRSQKSLRRPSQQCILFILIRYISIVTVLVSNIGFFASFSPRACGRFFLLAPIFKVLQAIISQSILGLRTYTISRKASWVFYAMLAAMCLSVPVMQSGHCRRRLPDFIDALARILRKFIHETTLVCTTGNQPNHREAWIHYAVAMSYDLVAIGISSGYLWSYKNNASRLCQFVRTMMYEGLGYFVIITAVNIFNLVFYHSVNEDIQAWVIHFLATLGYVIIWIMSQRILVKQRGTLQNAFQRDYGIDAFCRSVREIRGGKKHVRVQRLQAR
ncbi:hypothetical protein SCHPADRAFT_823670 [Schizopora paradoxa]|uniref:DUF6533 domain-containing protein n=1 Tax=Schizopora paradoxa TaxID=27342 RepID=A0A0H2SGB2_9AGAM|nr:hypothetical protein SCHPADRAFT_823670 [Schizopora paradoxa]